jgi:hypothetical protein
MLIRIMMVWQCKAKKETSVLSAYTRTMSIRMLWWTLGIATITRKTVNVLSFNKMYFVEIYVYNVKSTNSIQECNIGVNIQRNTIVFCPLTNCSTQNNKAGFLATNSLHTRHRKVGEVFGVDHTVITWTLPRFQQHGTPVRRHVKQKQNLTYTFIDTLLFINKFCWKISTVLVMTHRLGFGSDNVYSIQQSFCYLSHLHK